MSVVWPLPETATCEEIQEASQQIINTLLPLSNALEVAQGDFVEIEPHYIALKAVRDIRQNNFDRALYKLEVLQARLNTSGC